MNLVKIISTTVDNLGMRLPKFLRLGKSDVQTATQAGAHGIDSNPIADMIAVYADTGEKGEKVILGYLNKNQLAEPGEFRIFSVNAEGELQTFIWLKANGTIQIGGNAKNMVRFQELETGFNQLKDDFNAFLTHVHGGSGTPPAPPVLPSTASIAGAKIDEITTL